MSKVFSFACMVLFMSLSIETFTQHIRFQKTYSIDPYKAGIKNREVFYYDVETLSDDGFATLGFLTDTLNRSEGFIARYDCTGKIMWTRILGNSGSPTNTNAGIVEADNGDLVFSFNLGTGFFRASILCGRINPSGQTVWMKRIGNNTEFGRDIAKTKDGGFIVVGSTGAHGTDNLADDVYLFKLDANGNVLWNKTFGNPGGTYDEAYAVKLDSQGNIIVTGRCIADATFQAFILKADPDGNPIQFKTYGYNNQRTNAFDLIVDKEDNYLITGFTTILEFDHTSSENDPFLIKVDSAMNTLFANVYEVSLGSDISTIGEGLCQLDNGDYGIGVSSSAFSTHNINGPNAPNKNALYIIQKNGNLRKAFIYNQHGSQYTRVRKSSFGSVLLSGFSRAYTDKVHSQGLIIKTDNSFFSGCYDIDVTNEIAVYKPTWQIADYSYLMKSGVRSVDYFNVRDTSLSTLVLCEEIPLLNPDFEGPDTICPGNVLYTDLSAGPGTRYWIVDQDTIRQIGDLNYTLNTPGNHDVSLVLEFSCIVKSLTKSVHVLSAYMDTVEVTLCQGEVFYFKGASYDKTGIYQKNIPGAGTSCDSMFTLNIVVNAPSEKLIDFGKQFYCDTFLFDTVLSNASGINDTISFKYSTPGTLDTILKIKIPECTKIRLKTELIGNCDCVIFPNVFTPEYGEELNREFKPHYACGYPIVVEEYTLTVFNRWGLKVFEGNDIASGWNGQYKGEPAPMETYIYVSEFKIRYNASAAPIAKSKEGTVTLIR